MLGSRRARHELHSAAGEQRGVAEDAALLDSVDSGSVGARVQSHLPRADHPHVIGDSCRVVGDDGARREVDQLGTGRKVGELVGGHCLERGVRAKERRKIPYGVSSLG